MRCERQTLYRLPASDAIVFSVRTCQYPIPEIKEEGSGENFAQAIEGLHTGSAPGIDLYKHENVWGQAVKHYLRGTEWKVSRVDSSMEPIVEA